MSDLVYLYGFVPADAPPPENLTGMGDRAVEILNLEGVAAAISRVAADTYSADRVEARLQDLSWVAEQGVAHETVVAWFVDHTQILPVPLFTMYSSDGALRQQLAGRSQGIATELHRLANKREWDVKISFNEADLERHASAISPRIAEMEAEIEAAAPGRRYLLQKKRADLLKSETRSAARAIAMQVMDEVSALTVERRSLPIPRTAEDLPVIAYNALLVKREREGDLVQMLEQQSKRLQSVGMSLSFSGPWAPYRFTGEHERTAAG